jgi:hypothetical protein
MSKSILRRALVFAKADPTYPIIPKKLSPGKQRKISAETRRILKKILSENPHLSAVKLERCIPALENVSICTIQYYCLKDLQFPPRKGQEALAL